jgi:hypothetical protein
MTLVKVWGLVLNGWDSTVTTQFSGDVWEICWRCGVSLALGYFLGMWITFCVRKGDSLLKAGEREETLEKNGAG